MKVAMWCVVLILLGGLGAAAWQSGALQDILPAPEIEVAKKPAVPLVEPSVIRALGYVEPVSELRRLVFKVDGVIDSCRVEIGQRVKQGDVLMTLRNHDESAAVALAEQELAVAIAEKDQLLAGTPPDQIAAAEHKMELQIEHVRHTQRQLDRAYALVVKKTITEADLDSYETDVIRAKRSLQQAEAEWSHLKNIVRPVDQAVAEAKVKRAEAHLRTTQARLSDTILTAPFDGTVLEILRREGESPRPLDREPVIVFADISQLRVRAEIDERFVANLLAYQKATVFGRGLGDKQTEGAVSLIKTVMGPKTVFSHNASERKDLDIVQVFIDLPADFQAPIGLQVDVDLLNK